MKIVIFSPTSTILQMDPKQPLGGADTTLVKLIQTLGHLGHDVTAFIPVKKEVDNRQNISIKPYMDAPLYKGECDILILYRKMWALPPNIKYKHAIFYSQDMPDTPCFDGRHKQGFNTSFDQFTTIIALSKFHKEQLCTAFNIPAAKVTIIGNAADPYHPDECDKKPLTFIYASTPYRGLHILARMWKKIVARLPDAQLHVYSSMKIYGDEKIDAIHFEELYNRLKMMKGVHYHGSVPREEMLDTMRKAQLHLYPNTYPETYCNVVMEARACHTPTITTNKGALEETAQGSAAFIPGDPYSDEYQDLFIQTTIDLATKDRTNYHALQRACHPIRTWNDYAFDIKNIIEKTGDQEWSSTTKEE